MAYFDSSKNRALWEIRLNELKREKAAREAGGSGQAFTQEQAQKQASQVTRVPITYQELLKQEAMASEKNKRERGTRSMERGKAREQTREKEAQTHEMA